MQLRFTERDGKKILQYRQLEWDGGIFWQDVPFEHGGRPWEAAPCAKEELCKHNWVEFEDGQSKCFNCKLPRFPRFKLKSVSIEEVVKVIEEEFVRDGSTLGINTKNALIDHVKKLVEVK